MYFHKYKHVHASVHVYLYTHYYFTLCIYLCAYGHTQVYYYTYTFIYPDIDECSDGTHVCTPHTCINTDGSYTCGCNTGYLLETDEITCRGMCTCTEVYSCM